MWGFLLGCSGGGSRAHGQGTKGRRTVHFKMVNSISIRKKGPRGQESEGLRRAGKCRVREGRGRGRSGGRPGGPGCLHPPSELLASSGRYRLEAPGGGGRDLIFVAVFNFQSRVITGIGIF